MEIRSDGFGRPRGSLKSLPQTPAGIPLRWFGYLRQFELSRRAVAALFASGS